MKMVTVVCDRCGCSVERGAAYAVVRIMVKDPEEGEITGDYRLCTECARGMVEYIEGGGDEP